MRDARVGRCAAALLVGALGWLAGAGPVSAQGRQVHGADSIFTSATVAIVWAVLKGPAERSTFVVTRILNTAGEYKYLRVEGLDPFTQARTTVVDGLRLEDRVDVRSPRPSFARFPSRKFHLYRTAAAWRAGTPALTVYYLGIPDTTPELTSEAGVLSYLSTALSRAR